MPSRLATVAHFLLIISLLSYPLGVVGLAAAQPLFVSAQTTTRLSVSSSGAEANADSGSSSNYQPATAISADGRFTAFTSAADNLVANDSNGHDDIFVHDRQTGLTELVSVSSSEAQADYHSSHPAISADGRYITFASYAANLVANDNNSRLDIFVRDRQAGLTERVSVANNGAESNGDSGHWEYTSSISADGRYIAFKSISSNLVANDFNGEEDIFVRDRQSHTTLLVSVDDYGLQGNCRSGNAAISAGGRFVAFESCADNLVLNDGNQKFDIFIHDLQTATTELVSLASSGVQANDDSYRPDLTSDGRFIVFESTASNLAAGDGNGVVDVFLHDRQAGNTELISKSTGGVQANSYAFDPSISDDARYIAYESAATNLVANDTNGSDDIFLRDRLSSATSRLSVSSSGVQGNDYSMDPSISSDGRCVAFQSDASNLVASDNNGYLDIFLRDLGASTPVNFDFSLACFPGLPLPPRCLKLPPSTST